ncbi:SDR family NAD(P)-dependent oxidoreductase [Halosegnis marinus]|uniref:SDR family NAD(P)-dependent oxidoreductase n=1 Tax=Halosegnis marinus TaxID=3034023 RepID=A0ABD5ZKS2_9EURY|nr:SDR family NAD(P)-dependent oxidoreductase [Halosegnis sp. DT85]
MELHDDLSGQVALVTGANRGIGAEIARNLDDLGATVYAGTRSMNSDVPDGCEQVLLDVTQEGDIDAIADGVFGEVGRLDILVNNAGIGEFGDDIVAEPAERIDRTLATNLRGPMLLCKHLVPLLVQREGGRVVNVSSGMGALADMGDGSPAYRVSKTGLNGLTRYLHAQYNEQGLIANAVCPGWVRTDMGGSEADRPVEKGAETPTWLCRFAPGSESGRFWRDRERIDW